MKIVWLPKSVTDLSDHANYLATVSTDLSIQFLDAVKSTCGTIAASPWIGAEIVAVLPQHVGIRVWPVRRFRAYLLFYRIHKERIEIVRLLHGAKNWEGVEI
jgi:toxin ParE1/3/4